MTVTTRPIADGSTGIVFILGTGRCGSSLLQELVSRHPGVGFLSNVEDRWSKRGGARLGRFNNALYRRVPQHATTKGRARFAPSEGYRALEREVSHLVTEPGRPLTAADATPWLVTRFQAFFETRAAAQQRPVFAHKFTGWPRAGFVAAAFPEARFVNVVRDGRAVASSLVQMDWWRDHRSAAALRRLPPAQERAWRDGGERFPVLAGLLWRLMVEAHEEAARRIAPERWLELRYEDLLDEPRKEMTRLVEFCGLDWTPEFEEQFASQQIRPARRDAFRRDLGAEDLRQLDDLLGETLERYGYPRLGSGGAGGARLRDHLLVAPHVDAPSVPVQGT